MKRRMTVLSALGVLCAGLLLSACSTVRVSQRTSGPGIGNGPPAHAPAHGHRRKAAGSTTVTIETEAGTDVVWGIEGRK